MTGSVGGAARDNGIPADSSEPGDPRQDLARRLRELRDAVAPVPTNREVADWANHRLARQQTRGPRVNPGNVQEWTSGEAVARYFPALFAVVLELAERVQRQQRRAGLEVRPAPPAAFRRQWEELWRTARRHPTRRPPDPDAAPGPVGMPERADAVADTGPSFGPPSDSPADPSTVARPFASYPSDPPVPSPEPDRTRPPSRFITAAWLLPVLLLGGGVLTLVFTDSASSRSDRIAATVTVAALGGVAVLALLRWRQLGRSAPVRPLDVLSQLLATAVSSQWSAAAAERRLRSPLPIPVRWEPAAAGGFTGPLTAVLQSRPGPLHPDPVPGLPRFSAERLTRGGDQEALHELYGGFPSGRLVLIGGAGSGKTTAGILLVLRALQHREEAPAPLRARIPVPVILNAEDWQPGQERVEDWLARRIAGSFPFLSGPNGAAEAAALVDAGRVSLVLDDLDDVEEHLRPVLLEALSLGGFRVVVLARTATMLQAARHSYLAEAAAVRLVPVRGPVAADYLARAARGSAQPPGWGELLRHLTEHPDGPLARGVSTPLALTLLRDTFRADDDVSHLLDAQRRDGGLSIEDVLLARVIGAAYAPAPGRRARYDTEQAVRTLTWLATEMSRRHTRQVTWWQVTGWVPTWPRALVTIALLTAAAGLYAGPPGLAGGSLIGGAAWIALVSSERSPSRLVPLQWRKLSGARVLVGSLLLGLGSGLAYGLQFGPAAGTAVAAVAGLGSWLVFGVSAGLSGGLLAGGEQETRTVGSVESWRNDLRGGLVRGVLGGLIFGVVTGALYGLIGDQVAPVVPGGVGAVVHAVVYGSTGGVTAAVTYAVIFGLAFGAALGLVYSQTWLARLAFVQLRLTRRIPFPLLAFLEDARQRGVLRTVGPAYQFRHARLQDLLAARPDRPPPPD